MFALLFVFAGLFVLYRINLGKRLHSKIESIRAAGYPLTMQEWENIYSVDANSENAADSILEAMQRYYNEPNGIEIEKFLEDINIEVPVHSKSYSKDTVTLINQFLIENENALELLHKASTLQYSRYPEDLKDTLIFVTNAIKLLNIEAIYFSETGDSESALRSITASFNIGDSLAKDPRFIFYSVRMYSYSISISSLKRIINRVDFTEQQLSELDKCINNALNYSDLRNVFAGEMSRVFQYIINDNNINEDIIPREIPLPVAQMKIFFYKHLGMDDTDRILYLDFMKQYLEAAELPLEERYDTFQQIDGEIRNVPGIHLLNIVFPHFYGSIKQNRKYITKIQTAQIAIAVMRYCMDKGIFPDNFDELIPAYLDKIPKTAYGKELKFKKIDEGCIIYSEENGKKNINKTIPQSDLINHGISNLGIWFMIENEN